METKKNNRETFFGRETAVDDRMMVRKAVSITPSSLNEEARTVDAVLATENVTQVFDPVEYRVIDEVLLSDGVQIGEKGQVPLLEVHDRFSLRSMVGSARNIRLKGKKVLGTVHFAEGLENAEADWQLTRQGHLTDVSVGYIGTDYEDIPAGERKAINGRNYKATNRVLRVTKKWQLRELSLVPIGADAMAQVRCETEEGKRQMNEALRKYLEETCGLERGATEAEAWSLFGTLAGDQKIRASMLHRGTVTEPGTPAEESPATPQEKTTERAAVTTPAKPEIDSEAIAERAAERALERERKRVADIENLAGEDVPANLVTRAIKEGWSMDRVHNEFLTAVRTKHAPVNVEVGTDHGPELVRALGSMMVTRANVGYREEDPKAKRAADEFRGAGLHDIARICLQHAGVRIPHNKMELAKRAAAISTGTFTELLGTSVNRVLHEAYLNYPGTLLLWAGRRIVNDFKDNKDIKLSEFSSVPKIGKGGELEHGDLSEAAESFKADTYGLLFYLDRQRWINDDLDGFMRVPAALGRAASRNIDTIGYNQLTSNSGVGPVMAEDSKNFFSKTHQVKKKNVPNYVTGTAESTLDNTGLKNGKETLRKHQGLAGEYLNLIPRKLIAPPELEQAALSYTRSSTLEFAATGDTDATFQAPSVNVHAGSLEPIIEPRLSESTVDAGTTAWYMACAPEDNETMIVAFLRGMEDPTVEDVVLPAEILGVGWRMYHDFGIGFVDWRGIVRMKGAA